MIDSIFVSAELHEREITLPDGSAAKFHFRKVSAIDWNQYQMALSSDDGDVKAEALIRLVMHSLCEPDGKRALTWEQATRLDPDVCRQMWKEAQSVCAPSKGKA